MHETAASGDFNLSRRELLDTDNSCKVRNHGKFQCHRGQPELTNQHYSCALKGTCFVFTDACEYGAIMVMLFVVLDG